MTSDRNGRVGFEDSQGEGWDIRGKCFKCLSGDREVRIEPAVPDSIRVNGTHEVEA